MNFQQLWSLARLCFGHPQFVIPTVCATQKTLSVSNTYFGRAHHHNGKANAFRHALWNALLYRYCSKWTLNSNRALVWTTIFTDWHEEFSPNPPLAKAMDLHNNKEGRRLAKENAHLSISALTALILEKSALSRKLHSIAELKQLATGLIHIEK